MCSSDLKVAQYQPSAPMYPAVSPPPQAELDNAMKLAAEIGYADSQDALVTSVFQEKIANASDYERVELVNAAQDAGRDDLLVKAAAEIGYQDAHQKIAAAQYGQGENDALQQVHKVATDEFLKGAQEASILVQRARQQQVAQ